MPTTSESFVGRPSLMSSALDNTSSTSRSTSQRTTVSPSVLERQRQRDVPLLSAFSVASSLKQLANAFAEDAADDDDKRKDFERTIAASSVMQVGSIVERDSLAKVRKSRSEGFCLELHLSVSERCFSFERDRFLKSPLLRMWQQKDINSSNTKRVEILANTCLCEVYLFCDAECVHSIVLH